MKGTIRNYLFKATVLSLLCFISYKGYLTLEYTMKIYNEYEVKKCVEDCLLIRHAPKQDLKAGGYR